MSFVKRRLQRHLAAEAPSTVLLSNTKVCEASRLLSGTSSIHHGYWNDSPFGPARVLDFLSVVDALVLYDQIGMLPSVNDPPGGRLAAATVTPMSKNTTVAAASLNVIVVPS